MGIECAAAELLHCNSWRKSHSCAGAGLVDDLIPLYAPQALRQQLKLRPKWCTAQAHPGIALSIWTCTRSC